MWTKTELITIDSPKGVILECPSHKIQLFDENKWYSSKSAATGNFKLGIEKNCASHDLIALNWIENRALKKMLEDGKEDHNSYKTDQARLLQNLRI